MAGSLLVGLPRQAQDASGIPCEVANGGIELRERYFHARTLGYGWNAKIAIIGAPQYNLFTDNLSSTPLFPLLCDQASDSLPGAQFPVKHHRQLRESFSELAGFEEVGRIPRAARKLKLRARVSLKQQNAIRAKSAGHPWKERSLQKLNAQDQIVAALRELRPLQVRLYQRESAAKRPPSFMEAFPAAHWSTHAACASFQNVQSNAGKIYRRDVLAPGGKKQCMPSRAASNVQRRANRQQRQEFADDTRRLGGRRLSDEPVLCVPDGLARGHKKGS